MKINTLIKSLIIFYLSLIILASLSVYDLIIDSNKIHDIHQDSLSLVLNSGSELSASIDLDKLTKDKEDISKLKSDMDRDLIIIYTIMIVAAISFLFTFIEVRRKILNPIYEMNNVISQFQEGAQNIKEIPSNDDEIGVMVKEFFIMKKMLDDDYAALEKLATTDPMTGILNRRSFFDISEKLLKLSLRNKSTFSIVLLDIDFFKKVNDTYGHLAGDEIIKYLVKMVKKEMRESDVFSRFGGEEFIILLPETDEKGASILAEKLRKNMDDNPYVASDLISIPVTVSIGISELKEQKLLRDIIYRADQALYEAKEAGRNIVKIA